MIYIKASEIKALKAQGLSFTQLAKHYQVDVFTITAFLYSHRDRNGTYPADGTRSRAPVKPHYVYPSKKALVGLLRTKSINDVAIQYNIPYITLQRYIQKLDIKPEHTLTLLGKREAKQVLNSEEIEIWKKLIK